MTANAGRGLLANAVENIERYNQVCLHYNLVAKAVYQELRALNKPFSVNYEPYLIAALISFDMGRMMGEGLSQKYDLNAKGFATTLHQKLGQIKQKLELVIYSNIIDTDIDLIAQKIKDSYDILANSGKEGFNQKRDFHVGSTKILHFLNPELFMIIDANIARILRIFCGIPYKNTTQPGYSGELYVRSLKVVKKLIVEYGEENFRSLENQSPIMRVFDKIAFASTNH
jgi:hypothetical protein